MPFRIRKPIIGYLLLALMFLLWLYEMRINRLQSGAKDKILEVETIFSKKENFKQHKPISKFLYYSNAFLIDIDILKRVQIQGGTFQNTFSKRSNKFYFTYGILEHDLTNWNKEELKNKFDLDCDIEVEKGHLLDKTITTNVYLICPKADVQISVFYERGNYYWIGSNENSSRTAYWFGDIPRATQRFQTEIFVDQYSNVLWATTDVKQFLYDYQYSKFLECNHTLAAYNQEKMGESYRITPEKITQIIPTLTYIARVLERFQKRYWLHSGTLLGWYRDCGILPHVNDIDIGMFATDYETKIKKAFMGNKNVTVRRAYGIPNDTLEFRMNNGFFAFDLFFFYKGNATHMFSGYHGTIRKYKSWFKIFNDICSAEIYGFKFLVPCNPINVLSHNYGPFEKWMHPVVSGFKYSSVDFKGYENWKREEWPHVRKVYDNYGKINMKETLELLKQKGKPLVTHVEDPDL